jgi:hypothetical protein
MSDTEIFLAWGQGEPFVVIGRKAALKWIDAGGSISRVSGLEAMTATELQIEEEGERRRAVQR